jgi:hypothetical protein
MSSELSAGEEVISFENSPVLVPSSITSWRNLTVHDDDCQVVISLMCVGEMDQCGILDYIKEVQLKGKIFIHFPFNCMTNFDEINTLLLMIHKYIDQKILIYCPINTMRSDLFIACCMIFDDMKLPYVLKKINLSLRYKKYVKKFEQNYHRLKISHV